MTLTLLFLWWNTYYLLKTSVFRSLRFCIILYFSWNQNLYIPMKHSVHCMKLLLLIVLVKKFSCFLAINALTDCNRLNNKCFIVVYLKRNVIFGKYQKQSFNYYIGDGLIIIHGCTWNCVFTYLYYVKYFHVHLLKVLSFNHLH